MKKSVIVFILILGVISCTGQNLYDLKNSKSFASYLSRTKQYSLAAQEYERIVFLDPNDASARLSLIQSYRLSEQYPFALKRLNELHPKGISSLTETFTDEYIKLLFYNKNFDIASDVINISDKILPEKKSRYQMGLFILNNQWDEAYEYSINKTEIKDNKWNSLKSIATEHQSLKYKSPFLAASFSTIIPGSGKIYTSDWKDGLFALLFTGTSIWQSYRGFHKNGLKSAYGWIFGAIAIGYYGGNIYGSWKAAKIFNSNLDHELFHKAESIIFSDF